MAVADLVLSRLSPRFHEQCRAIGGAETISFRRRGGTLIAEDLDFSELEERGILEEIKRRARAKDANVVQVLFVNRFYDKKFSSTSFSNKPAGGFDDAAVDIRYWSCPVQNAQ